MQQTDRDRGVGREGRDLLDRRVVAVVHEQDFRTERGESRGEPVEQQRDALLLVAGGYQDGQPGRGTVAARSAAELLDAWVA